MSHNIKCPKCKTWNENQDYCTNCNEILNQALRTKIEWEQREAEYQNRPKGTFDVWLETMKVSDKIWQRAVYKMLQSAWFLFLAGVMGMLGFALLGPG
jgi:hypothetical protein